MKSKLGPSVRDMKVEARLGFYCSVDSSGFTGLRRIRVVVGAEALFSRQFLGQSSTFDNMASSRRVNRVDLSNFSDNPRLVTASTGCLRATPIARKTQPYNRHTHTTTHTNTNRPTCTRTYMHTNVVMFGVHFHCLRCKYTSSLSTALRYCRRKSRRRTWLFSTRLSRLRAKRKFSLLEQHPLMWGRQRSRNSS